MSATDHRGNAAESLVTAHARAWPDRVAARFNGMRVTYRQLDDAANRAGWALRAAGCRSGDRVLVAIPDSPQCVAALFGALKIGAVIVPISVDVRAEDLESYVAEIEPTLIIAHASLTSALTPRIWSSSRVAIVGDTAPSSSLRPWDELVENAPCEPHAPTTRSHDAALIAYTSGSTGAQKAAVHTHHNIITGSDAVAIGMFGLRPSDVVLSTSRLAFSFGFGFGLCLPLCAGASTVLAPERSQLEGCARLLKCESPSVLCAVPSFLASLLHAARSWLAVDTTSLRFVVSAGEPLPGPLYDGYREQFNLEVLDGIGSTEMFSHFIGARPGTSRRGSCGVAAPDCDVRLVDEHGHDVADGEIGSLRLRSGRACVGYANRSMAPLGDDGWLSTGDRLRRDEDGYFHFAGRDDDMLKVSGQWVSPLEVESALTAHPKVERCAITAREDGRGGRKLVAYVVPCERGTVTERELLTHVGARVPLHMIPSTFVVIPSLPLTPNGKVNRAALPTPDWVPQVQ
jgi:acyl-coenzyme A synthetase/AMP-(fatty) acid ligase